VVAACGGPFVTGGDRNIGAEQLIGSQWVDHLGAAVIRPPGSTCHSTCYGFFVLSRRLYYRIQDCLEMPGAPVRPHSAVTLKLRQVAGQAK
ncbi:unnamed protein product, partial [Prorocentrum cordatum]